MSLKSSLQIVYWDSCGVPWLLRLLTYPQIYVTISYNMDAVNSLGNTCLWLWFFFRNNNILGKKAKGWSQIYFSEGVSVTSSIHLWKCYSNLVSVHNYVLISVHDCWLSYHLNNQDVSNDWLLSYVILFFPLELLNETITSHNHLQYCACVQLEYWIDIMRAELAALLAVTFRDAFSHCQLKRKWKEGGKWLKFLGSMELPLWLAFFLPWPLVLFSPIIQYFA